MLSLARACAALLATIALVVLCVRGAAATAAVPDRQAEDVAPTELTAVSVQHTGSPSSTVDCGTRVAATCSACGIRCSGDCVWLEGGGCTPIFTSNASGPPRGFHPRTEVDLAGLTTVRVLDSSPLSTSVLALLLASAKAGPSLQTIVMPCARARDSGDAAAGACAVKRPAASHDRQRLSLDRESILGVRSSVGSSGGGGGDGGAESRRSSAAAPVLLLRPPEEALQAEWLPYASATLGHLPRAAPDGRCNATSLAALSPAAPAAPGRRLAALLDCGANPVARRLMATLPPSSATERCAAGQCEDSTLFNLAWHALLRLPWFGTLPALGPSLRLLERSLGLRVPPMDDAQLRWLEQSRWPWAGSGEAPSAEAEASRWADGRWRDRPPRLKANQLTRWRIANAVDMSLYAHAAGVLAYRLRAAALDGRAPTPTPTSPTKPDGAAQPPRPLPSEDELAEERSPASMVAAARVFGTDYGGGRVPAMVPPPVEFRRERDTLVFVHLAKCGGTSFNARLMSLDVGLPCDCTRTVRGLSADLDADGVGPYGKRRGRRDRSGAATRRVRPLLYHNGHVVVQPKSCMCARHGAAAGATARRRPQVVWSEFASKVSQRRRESWAFLQRQWLISPETTGWIGGVHAPVRVLQMYLMLSAKFMPLHPLARGLHYVALLREPIKRLLSEFYETYDGWEATFDTPPKLARSAACSARLPRPLRRIARRGIDNSSKAEYDTLFPHWIRCPSNMAASRQTRALAFNSLAKGNGTGGQLAAEACGALRKGVADARCSFELARRALYQFSFIGLNSERCAAERLFEAQFGLRFGASTPSAPASSAAPAASSLGSSTEVGKGAHRVAKLTMDELVPEDRRIVREISRDDTMLYREAERLFRVRLDAYGIPHDVRCH